MTVDTLATSSPTTAHAAIYPNDWRMVRLGDFIASCVLSLTNGYAQGGFNEDGQGVPHLRPFNVTEDGRIDLEHIKSVPAPRPDSSYWIRQGDIIFNNTNSEDLVGKTAYFPFDGKYVLSNHMTRIRILDSLQIDAAWLAYQFLLQWDHRVFKALCRRHVGQASISLDKLSNLTFPLPPLTEQRAIARILRAAQHAIAARRREVTLERERKAALMQRLFTHGVRGEPTKQTEIGEMPQSWQVVRLGDLVHMKYGYQTSIPSMPPANGTPIISTAEIRNEGRLELSRIRTVEIPQHQVDNYSVSQNDILFNWRNAQEHVGKVAIVEFTPDEPLIYASFIIRLRMKESVYYRYVHAVLTYYRQEGVFFRLSRRAVNQANFNANELAALTVHLPPLAEQHEIADTLVACDTHIAALEHEIALHDELFRTLLEELMSGRLSALPLVEAV